MSGSILLKIDVKNRFFYSLNALLSGVVKSAVFLPRSAEKVTLLRSPIERLAMGILSCYLFDTKYEN